MIAASPYLDNLRVVAQEHDVPLFDRFSIMEEAGLGIWGEFDLFTAVHGVELAKRVHNCLGLTLSQFITESGAPKAGSGELRKSAVHDCPE